MRVLSVYPVRPSRQPMNNRHCGSILWILNQWHWERALANTYGSPGGGGGLRRGRKHYGCSIGISISIGAAHFVPWCFPCRMTGCLCRETPVKVLSEPGPCSSMEPMLAQRWQIVQQICEQALGVTDYMQQLHQMYDQITGTFSKTGITRRIPTLQFISKSNELVIVTDYICEATLPALDWVAVRAHSMLLYCLQSHFTLWFGVELGLSD